jgi:hypothetical protein
LSFGSILWTLFKAGFMEGLKDWIGKKFFPERRGDVHPGGNGYLRHADFERFITTVITRPEFEARIGDLGNKIDSNGAMARQDHKDLRAAIETKIDQQWDKLDTLTTQILLNQSRK